MTIADVVTYVEPFAPALTIVFGLSVALTLVDWVVMAFLGAARGGVN